MVSVADIINRPDDFRRRGDVESHPPHGAQAKSSLTERVPSLKFAAGKHETLKHARRMYHLCVHLEKGKYLASQKP